MAAGRLGHHGYQSPAAVRDDVRGPSSSLPLLSLHRYLCTSVPLYLCSSLPPFSLSPRVPLHLCTSALLYASLVASRRASSPALHPSILRDIMLSRVSCSEGMTIFPSPAQDPSMPFSHCPHPLLVAHSRAGERRIDQSSLTLSHSRDLRWLQRMPPTRMTALASTHVVCVSCGADHTAALCTRRCSVSGEEESQVFVWGALMEAGEGGFSKYTVSIPLRCVCVCLVSSSPCFFSLCSEPGVCQCRCPHALSVSVVSQPSCSRSLALSPSVLLYARARARAVDGNIRMHTSMWMSMGVGNCSHGTVQPLCFCVWQAYIPSVPDALVRGSKV